MSSPTRFRRMLTSVIRSKPTTNRQRLSPLGRIEELEAREVPTGILYFSQDSTANGLFILDQATGAATLSGAGTTTVSVATSALTETSDPNVLFGSEPFGLLSINADGSGAVQTGSLVFEGGAFDPTTGVLYGAINGGFFTIDQATGTTLATLAGPGGDVEGLAYGNGVIYGLSGSGAGDLLAYNIQADTWSLIGDTGVAFDNIGLAFDPLENALYAKGNQSTSLFRINPATAATTVVGDTGLAGGGGLAFVPDPSLTGGTPSISADAGGVPVAIDPALTLTGTTLNAASVSITGNFVSAEDRLLFTNTPNITGSYNIASGILTLTGADTVANYQAALRSVQYQNINNVNPSTLARTATFSIAPGAYNPANGHFYEFVSDPGITWTDAEAAAAASTIFGLQGYLVTLTSAAENDFAFSKVGATEAWIGASDGEVEGDWQWVVGPEAGLQFWQGLGSGDGGGPVGGEYNNWQSPIEPNDAGGEDYAHFLPSGEWNDFPDDLFVQGYVVEYGGLDGDPTLQLTSQTTINVNFTPPAPPTTRYDMKASVQAPAVEGWNKAWQGTKYNATTGYGWSQTSSVGGGANGVVPPESNKAVMGDYAYGQVAATFQVKLEPYQTATVKIYSYGTTSQGKPGVAAKIGNGPTSKLTTNGVLEITGQADANGILNITFNRNTGKALWIVSAIEVTSGGGEK